MKPFQFKEFTVHHDKSAMKIGTDGVLLGAWCSLVDKPDSILDVGTGTGVIALQLAQRSEAEIIDAVELENGSYEQAVDNFEQSDWADLLFCYHISFQEFAKALSEEEEYYELIVSNPPFFQGENLTSDTSRNLARFDVALNLSDLVLGVSQLLAPKGVFATIIPYRLESELLALAKEKELNLIRRCHVKGTPNAEIKRSLLEFSFENKRLIEEQLIIEGERHQYTQDYKNLVQDFYMNM